MGKRPRAVQLALPATIVAILALIALWRVASPTVPAAKGTSSALDEALKPLTQLAEVLAENSIGRQASLEKVVVQEVVSPRTLWIGEDDHRVFVVLDPDVTNISGVRLTPGARATLIGLVRAAPPEDEAMRQWALSADTAKALRANGTYLHVTEIRPAGA